MDIPQQGTAEQYRPDPKGEAPAEAQKPFHQDQAIASSWRVPMPRIMHARGVTAPTISLRSLPDGALCGALFALDGRGPRRRAAPDQRAVLAL
jgi:hypothetical protein